MDVSAFMRELREQLSREGRQLYLLPFNRYDPSATEWWLVPVPARTAHPYGKIASFGYSGGIFIGFYFEKGFGPAVAAVAPVARRKGWLVDETWVWQRALAAMEDGSLAKAADEVAARSGLDTTVSVRVIPFEAGDEAAEPRARPPRVWLEWGLRAGRLVERDGHEFAPFEEARHVKGVASLSSLAAKLRSLPRQDWLWVDVYLGVVLGIGKAPQPATNWDSARLAYCCIEPWLPWVSPRLSA